MTKLLEERILEELDETYMAQNGLWDSGQIKSFISQALAEQRAEIRQEILKLLVHSDHFDVANDILALPSLKENE